MQLRLWTISLLLVLSCKGESEDTAIDNDGDGVAGLEDCDDGVASTYPGAPEICDGVDNDCDDTIDNNAMDARTWFVDSDGDTFGGSQTFVACEIAVGFAATSDDAGF